MNLNVNDREKYSFSTQRAILVFPFIFILLVLLPLAFLQLRQAEKMAVEEANRLLARDADYLFAHLQDIIEESEELNLYNAQIVQENCQQGCDMAALQDQFLSEIKTFAGVSSIYFGNLDGGLADAGREAPPDESYYLIGTENFAAGTFYKVDANDPTQLLDTIPDFDARERAWYQDAIAEDQHVWSDVYVLFTEQDLAMSSSLPVYTEEGDLLGVVANDIFLSHISDFLAAHLANNGGVTYLVDQDGYFIAASTDEALFEQKGNRYVRANLFDETSLISDIFAQSLHDAGVVLRSASTPKIIHFLAPEDGVFYHAAIYRLPLEEDLTWYAIIILPENLIKGGFIANRRILLLSFSAFALFTLVLTFLGNRWILNPLRRLTQGVRHLAKGKGSSIPNTSRLKEIRFLTDTFNEMSAKLQENMLALQEESRTHKEAKEQLALSEALYRALVEDAPGLVTSFLPEGEITFVNQNYADYYDKPTEELVGINFLSLLPEEEREIVMEKIRSLSVDNPVGIVHQLTLTPEGEARHQRWLNRAIFNEAGEIVLYQSFGEDVEESYKHQVYEDILQKIALAANRMETLEDIASPLHEMLRRLMPAENFHITKYDIETEHFLPIYFVDQKDELPFTTPHPLKESKSLTAFMLREEMAFRIDLAGYQRLIETGKIEQIGTPPASWMGVPLLAQGKVIGAITMQDYEKRNLYSKEDEIRLQIIAAAVANIVIQQQAREELAAHAQTNALLYLAAQEMSQTLELDTLYEKVYTIIKTAMPCDAFILSSYNAEDELIRCEFIIHDETKEDPAFLPPIPLSPEGKGIQSRVIRSGEALFANDLLKEMKKSEVNYLIGEEGELFDQQDEVPPEAEEKRTRSGLYIPLSLGHDVTGVLQVQGYPLNAYTPQDFEFLKALSSQISLSINNVRLFAAREKELNRRHQAEKDLRELNQQLEARVTKRTYELDQRVKMVESLNESMKNMMQDVNLANNLARDRAKELEKSNQELEAFTYSVSHDLRAPLRHIESFSRLIQQKETDLEPISRRYLGNIVVATERMRTLIEDLLALSRAGSKEMHLKTIQFNPIIDSILAQQFDEVEGREIVWTIGALPPTQADAGLMKIVWENLIGNALKYTRPREIAQIEIGFLSEKDKNTFFIRDNGTGFPSEYRDKVFNAFERLHSNEEFEGSGIGLAIVRRVIERHQGKIWAESEEGKGATFYFALHSQEQQGEPEE